MQPLAELTLTRPWRWGIVIIGDPAAEVPIGTTAKAVVTGHDVIVVSVRHAQDIGVDELSDERNWATATIHLRSLVESHTTERHVLCETVIATPAETVSIGDADGMFVVPAPSVRTRLIVSADDADPSGLETFWVDLVAI